MASESVNGMDMRSFEERVAEAREAYCNAINEALDGALARFLIPVDRLALLHDAAVFVAFMCAVKAAECVTPAGQQIERRTVVQQWWPIQKRMMNDVPPMCMEVGKEIEAKHAEGMGEIAS